jgi:hypothetical protein
MLCLVPKEKGECFLKLLNTVWSSGQKTFTPREGAKLIGTVILLAVVCPWLERSYHHLGDQMNKQLRKTYERIMAKQQGKQDTSEPDQLTLDQARINFIVEQISSKPFFNSRVAKEEMWAMKEATVVTSAIKAEVDWLQHEAIMRCLQGET